MDYKIWKMVSVASSFSQIFSLWQGIVRAIKDFQAPLKEHEVSIFVRRGGPNYQEGLRVMGDVGAFLVYLSNWF